MNQQDYIDRGDLASVEHALSILRCIDPVTSSVIESNEFVKIEITLRTWQQELFELMLKKMKEEELKGMSPKKSNGPGRFIF